MKQNILKLVCGLFVIGGLASCDDLFEPALENNHDITEMYSLPTFARGIIDNAFLTIPYSAEFNSDYCTDVATDDAVINDNEKNYKKMAMGSWTSQDNPMNQWEDRYHAIQYCNLFLENCDKVEWDYSSQALNQMHGDLYKGQALALRGMHFYFLLRAHVGKVRGEIQGLPIHLASEDGSSEFNQPRPSFKECIDQIIADFDEALKYVPSEYGDVSATGVPAKYAQIGATDTEYNMAFGTHQRGKIDGRMIAAFKAQVALFAASPAYASAGAMTWERAAQYAAQSLANVGGLSGVDPNGWTWYCNKSDIDNYDFTKPDPLEICWRGNVSESTTTIETNNYPPSLYGKGRINPTQNLVDAFPMANGYPISDSKSGYDAAHPYDNRDPRLRTYILVNGDTQGAYGNVINTAADSETLDGLNHENGQSTQTGYYMRKHTRDDVNLNPSTGKKHFGARIRYTEIFLAYAEAANEAQGPQAKVGGAGYSAYDVIKAIRARVHQGENWTDAYLESIKDDQAKMRELIRNERRLELCFENHRFWDLRRWQADLNQTAKGASITTNTATGALQYQYIDVEPRNFKDYMIYGPIPYSELLKWDQLEQNDGW